MLAPGIAEHSSLGLDLCECGTFDPPSKFTTRLLEIDAPQTAHGCNMVKSLVGILTSAAWIEDPMVEIMVEARCSRCVGKGGPGRRLFAMVGDGSELWGLETGRSVATESSIGLRVGWKIRCHPSCPKGNYTVKWETLVRTYRDAVERGRKMIWLPDDLTGRGKLSRR